jgi:UDP-N-acetylglucosamine/UDP-N-acetylgalactosamine diphosphorylase
VDLKPRNQTKIAALLEKGALIPNPLSIDIGDEVRLERLAGADVVIYPGCRIYGKDTVISSGVKLGAEAPATIDNCLLGPQVELRGGYFRQSVFLAHSNVGSGAQIREACLFEEEANAAHCVGLKQTILFPFVTLGSLINFCDCLMAGGTSRKNHSEVGSSYIHFNFTPDGDKATASLFGDVSRGVMLNQPPIFLGGQGGAVGPLRLGYGNVVAAGSILRGDYEGDDQLIVAGPRRETVTDNTPLLYRNLRRLVENNVYYVANLLALEQWYIHVRQRFFAAQEFGELVYQGALKVFAQAKDERLKRLKVVIDNMPASMKTDEQPDARKSELSADGEDLLKALSEDVADHIAADSRTHFLARMFPRDFDPDDGYIKTIQALSDEVTQLGTQWLGEVVDAVCERAVALLPSFTLFQNNRDD